jgi:DNA-directed RNA polymerase specialized sigma24 family protein
MSAIGSLADHLLVERCLEGDQAAWYAFHAAFHHRLLRMAARLLHDAPNRADLAEEIAGRVWLSLVVKDGMRLRAYDPDRGTLATFLHALVRQEVQLLFRWWARHLLHEVPLPDGQPDGRSGPAALLGERLEEYRRTLAPQERRFFDVHLIGRPAGAGSFPLSPCNRRKLKQRVLARLRAFLRNH